MPTVKESERDLDVISFNKKERTILNSTNSDNYDDMNSMRYNRNIKKTHVSKSSGNKKVIKVIIGVSALLLVANIILEYGRIDSELCEREGLKYVESYSPSGGPTGEYVGERQHDALDVVNIMIDNAEYNIKTIFGSSSSNKGIK